MLWVTRRINPSGPEDAESEIILRRRGDPADAVMARVVIGKVKGYHVRVGIEAGEEIEILRRELHDREVLRLRQAERDRGQAEGEGP